MAKDPPKVNLQKDAGIIRSAFKQGKKSVTLDGKLLKLRKFSKTRKVRTGPPLKPAEQVEVTVTEHWINAIPADGSKLPVYCVEQYAGKNGISGRSK